MSNQLQLTQDGSHTLYSDRFKETYHSIHGAVVESVHVFINAGFKQVSKTQLNILEIGFGTGLNAFLTLIEAEKSGMAVNYTTLELHPLNDEVYNKLNFTDVLNIRDERNVFIQMHQAAWENQVFISNYFNIQKHRIDLRTFIYPEDKFDVIYFDAFSPVTQPELWTQEIFAKVYRSLCPKGILTTYCAKGEVRRNMIYAGFKVERMPGPPGKREMLRGRKE